MISPSPGKLSNKESLQNYSDLQQPYLIINKYSIIVSYHLSSVHYKLFYPISSIDVTVKTNSKMQVFCVIVNFYDCILARNNLLTICGLALPRVVFITCPTRNPRAFFFPFR
jgi:hypothetical protein